MAYKHGAYGDTVQSVDRSAVKTKSAPFIVGTAPVHTVAGGAANRNRNMVVNSFNEAARLFGYSEDWAKFTLCEAMYAYFNLAGVGPLVLRNVLDVAANQEATEGTTTATPVNGRAIISNAANIVLDTVSIDGKELSKDYTLSYDYKRGQIIIRQIAEGSLGKEALEVTYKELKADFETDPDDVIGESDGEGRNTGLFGIMDMYQNTGMTPSILLSPGFSEIPAVHQVMATVSRKVNRHWDVVIFTDIPILATGGTQMTLTGASSWQQANGYTNENEKVWFPKMRYADGRIYHLSTLAGANKHAQDAGTGGIPYFSVSNTPLVGAASLYFGEGSEDLAVDDQTINDKLCQFGISSAAYVGGSWVLWGPHAAAYNFETSEDGDASIFDTQIQMMFHLTNDFQHRRPQDVDKPMGLNRLKQIVAEEQARLDALVSTGALSYGKVVLDEGDEARTDMVTGDYRFLFSIKTTPLAKSLTALVTDEGSTINAGGE